MSISRKFLANELSRLELRFHPDGENDEKAAQLIRQAIELLRDPPKK